MGSDLNITKHLQDYILKNGLKLHPIQREIIDYNLSLGESQRMQISISQCQFLHLIIKVSKIKPALETLMNIRNEKFDLVFIDADKMNYKKYYEISLDLLNKEGLVIIDNVLWHGEVVNKDINDKFTKSIRDLNEFISKDKRIEKVMVPFGDGMTVCRKI